MDTVFYLDHLFFLYINGLPHTALTDAVALLFSGIGSFGFIWIILGLIVFFRKERENHWFFLPFLVAASGTYFLVEVYMKQFFGRLRPENTLPAMIIDRLSDGYSFPSSHAAFAFAFAVVLVYCMPRWRIFFWLTAIGISFSRVYLGKHYPLDILVGALVGWGIGHISLNLSTYIVSKQVKKSIKKEKK